MSKVTETKSNRSAVIQFTVSVCFGPDGSHSGGFHQSLIPKQLLEVNHMLLTVLSGVEAGASSQPLVSLLERPEHGVEQHLVSGLLCCIQKLPGRHVVMAADTADESERAQNLLLRQQNLDNLIVGGGETLQHVQRQLVCGRIRTLQGQK